MKEIEGLFHRYRYLGARLDQASPTVGTDVAAIAFDRQLRKGFNDGELRTLAQLLARLRNNIPDDDADGSTEPVDPQP